MKLNEKILSTARSAMTSFHTSALRGRCCYYTIIPILQIEEVSHGELQTFYLVISCRLGCSCIKFGVYMTGLLAGFL